MVQTHVTWGKNTVFNTPATTTNTSNKSPTTSLFGGTTTAANATPSTATASSTTTPGLGTTFAAPATTGIFGAPTATPATPATPSGAFSFSSNPVMTPQPPPTASTPTSSIFGTPSTTPAFGTSSSSAQATTAATAATAAGLYNPHQAALQAHLNATLYQESTRLESQLLQLHAAYSPYQTNYTPTPTTPSLFGTAPPPQSQPQATTNDQCRFQHIFYDRMTPTQKTESISFHSTTTGHYPQKPNHIPLSTWNTALSRNPDSTEYIPVLITSAEGLHSRLVSQQQKMNQFESSLQTLHSTLDQMKQIQRNIQLRLEEDVRKNNYLHRRLMKIMMKVDLCRGKNIVLQPAEEELRQKLWNMRQNVEEVGKMLDSVKVQSRVYEEQCKLLEQEQRDVLGVSSGGGMASNNHHSALMMKASGVELNEDLKHELHLFLKEKSDGIGTLVKVLKKDERDFEIMKEGMRKATIPTK